MMELTQMTQLARSFLDRPDELLPGDLLLGVELEEGTDEVSTHDGLRSLCRCQVAAQKETWGSPTSRSGRSVGAEYTPGWVDPQRAKVSVAGNLRAT